MKIFCVIIIVLVLIFFGAFAVVTDELYSLQKYYDNLEYRYNTLKDEVKHTRANARYEYNRGWRDGYRIATQNKKGGGTN